MANSRDSLVEPGSPARVGLGELPRRRPLASAVGDDWRPALNSAGCPEPEFANDPLEVRAAYLEALRDPVRIHSICEEFRAAATVDRQHDEEDRQAGRRIQVPTLVLWGARGALDTWYVEDGGPLAIWRDWAKEVQGRPVEAGHFFPEEAPRQTFEFLHRFFRAAR